MRQKSRGTIAGSRQGVKSGLAAQGVDPGQFDYLSCGRPRTVRAWERQFPIVRIAAARLGAATWLSRWMTLFRKAAITCGATPLRTRLASSPRVTSRL